MTKSADSIYSARSEMADIIGARLAKIDIPARPTTGAIKIAKAAVCLILKSIPNLSDPTKGYSELLDESTPTAPVAIVDIKMDSLVTGAMLIASSDTADAAYTSGKESEADAEALRRNLEGQRVLGAKDAIRDWGVSAFGKELVGTITHLADGGLRDIDDYQLHEMFTHLLTATQTETWRQLQGVAARLLGAKFDFRTSIQTNVQKLQQMTERLGAAGITIHSSNVVLIVLGNVDLACAQPWGTTLIPALQKINSDYPAGTTHSEATLQPIMAALAKADAQRNFASAPSDGSLAAAANEVDTLADELAAETSDTDAAPAKRRSRKPKSKTRDRSRSTDRRSHRSTSKPKKVEDNPCPHCRQFGRWKPHPNTPDSKCYFNKKYKGWRGDTAIRMLNDKYPSLKLKYKERSEFPPDLGGTMVETDDDDSCSYVSSDGSVEKSRPVITSNERPTSSSASSNYYDALSALSTDSTPPLDPQPDPTNDPEPLSACDSEGAGKLPPTTRTRERRELKRLKRIDRQVRKKILSRQEEEFWDRAIERAEDERTGIAKGDEECPFRRQAEAGHQRAPPPPVYEQQLRRFRSVQLPLCAI
ncbi:hypothetical protein THAOC_15299 [Thalassiosira oceanica]|uniref:Uncharacterized protein n=1 Tax=Thalassiosira oceanica TaxID=159749 RepID=K0SSJ2_THAOC|nr:hypothetical protein THAOC_15299 [Thalassiosira oceanica]|eukprot:EJK64011.1 hypothetical protein THAOC_15299 [Thalassiosira oceanica]